MKYFVFVFLPILLLGEFNRTTSFIDAPTAYTLTPNTFQIGLNGSFSFGDGRSENHPYDIDYLNIRYSFIPGFELSLTSYTIKNFVLSLKYSFFRIEPTETYFALGIDDITYSKDIGPCGDSDDSLGMWDDDYSYISAYGKNPAELLSVYLAFSSKIINLGYLNLGVGRGRFIGYGPRSELFHFSIPESLGNFDFGAFFSYYYKYGDFKTGIEFDGRDFNTGIIYHLPFFPIDLGLALVKLEHFLDESRTWNPRVAFAISYNQSITIKKYNNYSFSLVDNKGDPVSGYLTILDENGNTILSENVSGIKTLKTEFSGPIMINVKADGFEEYNGKDELKGPMMEKLISLEKMVKEGTLSIKIFDLKSGKNTIGIVTVKDKDGKIFLQEEVTGSRTFIIEEGTYKVEVKPTSKNVYEWFGDIKIIRKQKTVLDIGLVKKDFRLVLSNIEFDIGKATIKPEFYSSLDDMAKQIKQAVESNPTLLIEIQGHTDAAGSYAKNLKLSQERAESVKDYLVKNHKIEPQRLLPKGYGETKPIAPNTSKIGRRKNRRVEFVILQK